MLALFDCKEYQANVGNHSHIHLLGKVTQLSEKSQTELFDLIRENIVDIIKAEEFYDLSKVKIIENKDGVIQVKLYGLTYSIHTCNY